LFDAVWPEQLHALVPKSRDEAHEMSQAAEDAKFVCLFLENNKLTNA